MPYFFFPSFEQLMSRADAAKWFGEVVPALSKLLLRLPSLLETHYRNADNGLFSSTCGGGEEIKTGLRLLESQEPGIVFLSQVARALNMIAFLFF